MGVRFKLEHASIVGWLARSDHPFGSDGEWDDEDFDEHYMFHRRRRRFRYSRDSYAHEPRDIPGDDGPNGSWRAPRVMLNDMTDFLEALPYGVVANEDRDRSALRDLAGFARRRLDEFMQREGRDYNSSEQEEFMERLVSHRALPSRTVANILRPLRGWFDVLSISCLSVFGGAWKTSVNRPVTRCGYCVARIIVSLRAKIFGSISDRAKSTSCYARLESDHLLDGGWTLRNHSGPHGNAT